MHALFTALLKEYELKPHLRAPLREQFLYVCDSMGDSSKEVRGSLQKCLNDMNAKLEKLEERFAYGEIDRDIFEKVAGKLRKEIQATKDQLKESSFELSNPELMIDQSLEIITNLSDFWVSSDYDSKRKLQEVLFPGGLCMTSKLAIIEPSMSIQSFS